MLSVFGLDQLNQRGQTPKFFERSWVANIQTEREILNYDLSIKIFQVLGNVEPYR